MNTYATPVPKDICTSPIISKSKKYICDNCHYAFITSQAKGELPTECPFCGASVSCGTLDISFDAS